MAISKSMENPWARRPPDTISDAIILCAWREEARAYQNDDVQFKMTLTDTGSNFQGEVWFIRATDLKNRLFEGPIDGEASDTFTDSGHPSGIDFNYYVFFIDVAVPQGGSGSLSVKDHVGNSVLARTYTAGTQSQELATIPSRTDEYTLTATLTGGQSSIHFIIAGGIENHWVI